MDTIFQQKGISARKTCLTNNYNFYQLKPDSTSAKKQLYVRDVRSESQIDNIFTNAHEKSKERRAF